ncbi:hypothetical protein SteCoe_8287 [Stentor coeruleus]|uniref:ubiquitinyl hydrolase 1 n=1 Tax=Stentor coeruleus TaxID=5963 RepID=A0A1R2CKN4_9CILI|nr:hypothetical protein SteCoe_8287 [Stentor coeruleus]
MGNKSTSETGDKCNITNDSDSSRFLNSFGEGQIRMLRENFDKYEKNGLDLKGFKKIMPYIARLPPKVIENAFEKFAYSPTKKITWESYCSAVSKYTLDSRDNKCQLLYEIFNISKNGKLNRTEAKMLETHLINISSYINNKASLISLFGKSETISFIDFRTWAYSSIDLHKALQPFEVIPSPNSEKEVFLKIMQDFQISGLKNNESYYLISATWFEEWSRYVVLEINLPSSNLVSYKPGRRPDIISNFDLLDRENIDKLKPNLNDPESFIILPKNMWHEFVKWYDGGPKIIRKTIKIDDVVKLELYPPFFKIFYQKTLKSTISEKPLQTFISITENVQSILYAVKSNIFDDEDLGVYIKTDDVFKLVDKNTEIRNLELKEVNICAVVFMSNSEGREIFIEINEDDLDFAEGDNVEYKNMGQWVLGKVKRVNDENFILESRDRNIINVSRSEIGRLRKPKLELLVNKKDYLFCGIKNVAKSCSISTVLQVLFYTPLINDYFSNEKFIKNFQGLKYYSQEIMEFGKMFNDLKDIRKTVIDPSNFIRAFKGANIEYAGQNPCDAFEFLQSFLGNLHNALIDSKFGHSFPHQITFETQEEEINTNSQWQEYIGQGGSIISTVFGLQKKTSYICMECKKYKSDFEVSNYISVSIPSSKMSKIYLTIITRNCLYLKRLIITVHQNMTLEDFIIQVDNKSSIRYKNLIFSHVANSNCENCFIPTSIQELLPNKNFQLYGYEIITLIKDAENIGTFIAKHKMNLNWRNNLQINELVDYYYKGRWEFAHIKRLRGMQVDIVVHVKENNEECVGKNSSNLEFYRTKTVSANKILVIPITHFKKNNQEITSFGTPCILSIGCWCTWYDLNNEIKRICWQFCDKSIKVESLGFFYLNNKVNRKCEVCKLDCNGCEIPDNFETLECLAENYNNLCIRIIWKNSNTYKPLGTEILSGDEISSLEDCLSGYTQASLVEMNCSCCFNPFLNSYSELMEIPEILIFHLNRIEYNPSGAFTRINTLVRFPLKNFDIRRMMINKITNANRNSNNSRRNYLYDLYACIDHRGNVSSGHYTAYCKTQNGEWLHFDDEKVSLINKDFEEEIVTSRAYILFYKRQKFRSANIVRKKTIG